MKLKILLTILLIIVLVGCSKEPTISLTPEGCVENPLVSSNGEGGLDLECVNKSGVMGWEMRKEEQSLSKSNFTTLYKRGECPCNTSMVNLIGTEEEICDCDGVYLQRGIGRGKRTDREFYSECYKYPQASYEYCKCFSHDDLWCDTYYWGCDGIGCGWMRK